MSHTDQQQQPPATSRWNRFIGLNWYDRALDFLFRLTAKSSEVLLAVGVILSTANHFQHGALFDHSSPLFKTWTWTQAIGFEASAGVVLAMALDADHDKDKVKRNILLALMGGLALVGTVMLVMAFVEAATGIQESSLPAWYGITMAIVRGVVSVAYVTIGRVKNRRFSGDPIVSVTTLPHVLEKLDAFGTLLEQMGANSEQHMRHIEANTEHRIQEVTGSVRSFSEQYEHSLREMTELLQSCLVAQGRERVTPIIETLELHAQALSALPGLTEQLGHIEETTQDQLRVVVEEVMHVKTTLEQHTQALPKWAERIVKSELRRVPDQHRITAPNIRNLTNANVSVQSEANTSAKREFDKGQFVRNCLSENPVMRNSDIQRKASTMGQSISPAYISETRKAFFERRSTQAEEGAGISEEGEPSTKDIRALA
jgi:type III secretory pathway component EscS